MPKKEKEEASYSTFSISYKLRKNEALDAYFDELAPIIKQLILWLHDQHLNGTPDTKAFVELAVKSTTRLCATHLPTYLAVGTGRPGYYDDTSKQATYQKMTRQAVKLQNIGVFPLPFLQPLISKYKVNSPVSQVIFEAVKYFSNWLANDKNTQKNYKNQQAEAIRLRKEISNKDYADFTAWLTHCESNNYFKLSGKIPKYVVRNALRFANSEVQQALQTYFPQHKSTFSHTTLISACTEAELAARRLLRIRQTATFKMPDESKASLTFTSSFPEFMLAFNDDNPSIILKLPGKNTIPTTVCVKAQTQKANSVISNVTAVREGRNCYRVEFTRHGRVFNAKCASLLLQKRRGEIFAQLLPEFENNLTPPLLDAESTKVTCDELNRVAQFVHKCGYKRANAAGEVFDPTLYTVMGVDLGIRHPVSYTVVNGATGAIIDQNYADGAKDLYQDNMVKYLDKYSRLLQEAIWAFKDKVKTDPVFANDRATQKQYFATNINPAVICLKSFLKDCMNKGNKQRAFNSTPNSNWYQYVMKLTKARSLLISAHTLGKTPLPRNSLAALKRPPLFPKLLKYIDNFKKNLLKKIAHIIAKVAVQNNVHYVVLEDLANFKTSNSNESNLNSLLSIWNIQTILDKTRHALSIYGIALATVDPRHTSQLDPVTGEFGFRDQFDKDILHVVHNGQVEQLPADITASHNIANRFLTQASDLVYLRLLDIGNNEYIPVTGRKEGLGPVATQGIYKMTGDISQYVKFVLTNNKYTPITIDELEYKTLLRKHGKNAIIHVYKHRDRWLPDTVHYAIVNSIAPNRLRKQASEGVSKSQSKPLPKPRLSKTLGNTEVTAGA